MKTLLFFQEVPQLDEDFAPKFLALDGDYRRLNDVYVNFTEYGPLTTELTNLIYDENGGFKVQWLREPTKDWDFFVHCGFGQ